MNFRLGSLTIDPVELGSRGNAILGIRDSGKTVTAKVLAEHLFDASIPFVAFDPVGVWRHLRVPGRGRGRPVVVAGGADGDLPLNPATAPQIVEAAMQSGLSLVIDLFHPDLSKADWRRVVRDCVRMLLHKNSNYGLRHIFLEEAAEFIPQRVIDGAVYAEVEKLARMGGNARLGYTLINQRAEEVNKAVLELCDNLFLHRQKGRNSITALSKWLDIGNVKDARVVIDSLSTLPSGECWAWLHGSEQPVRVKVPMTDSLHPDRRHTLAKATKNAAKPVGMEEFVERLKKQLPKIEEEQKANDPKLLRARIVELEREIAKKGAAPASADALAEERMRGRREQWAIDSGWHASRMAEIKTLMNGQSVMPPPEREFGPSRPAVIAAIREAPGFKVGDVIKTGKGSLTVVAKATASRLPPARQRILDRLAYLASIRIDAPTRTQLALWCDASPTSGAFSQNLAALKNEGLIDYPKPDTIALTDDGRREAAEPEKITQDAMHAMLFQKVGAPQGAILKRLFAIYPDAISRVDLADQCGVSRTSGAYSQNLAKLAAIGVIGFPPPGNVAATNICFLED